MSGVLDVLPNVFLDAEATLPSSGFKSKLLNGLLKIMENQKSRKIVHDTKKWR